MKDDTLRVKCLEDDYFIYSRAVNNACGKTFPLMKDNVYMNAGTDYFGDEIFQYYTICPRCGYMVLLREENLPLKFKESAYEKMQQNPYQFKINSLILEMIYWRAESEKEKIRKRVRI